MPQGYESLKSHISLLLVKFDAAHAVSTRRVHSVYRQKGMIYFLSSIPNLGARDGILELMDFVFKGLRQWHYTKVKGYVNSLKKKNTPRR